MGLNNIQQKKNTVLNRPMFARMRDGRIVPVQRHWIGAAIGIGTQIVPRVLPMIPRSRALVPYVKKPLQKYVVPKIKSAKDSLWKALGWGTALGTAPLVISEMTDKKDTEVDDTPQFPTKPKFKSGIEEEGGPKGKYTHEKKEVFEEDTIKEKIKDGSLDEMITERMELFNKHLGDSKDQVKAGGWQALTEFGLNLASARGGNTMDKIARSAKDPLKTFTSIGAEAAKRADKIKMAAIESGVSAHEAKKGREADMDIAELQQMPDFVKTLNYFETIPELAALDAQTKARLAKTKAVQSDEEFIREISVELIKQGEDAIDGILNVATQGDAPRAYEVAAQMIKTVADVNKDLIDLHKKVKEINKEEVNINNTTNQSIYVGSTSDLQDLINQERSRTKAITKDIIDTDIIDD